MKTLGATGVLCALIVQFAAACADLPKEKTSYTEPKVYRTGSNIPVKDYGAMSDVKVVDPKAVRGALDGATQPVTVNAGSSR